MSAGINPDLAIGWLSATVNNTPFVVAMNAVQLFTGDPGPDLTDNESDVTSRELAAFSTPVETADGIKVSTTGAPPTWIMTASETISYIAVRPELTGSAWTWIARLDEPREVAEGDEFTMGQGISLTIVGIAEAS